jgi:uncharacterized protein YcfJ
LKYIPEGDIVPLNTIETTERWVRGEIDIEEVKIAEYKCWEYWEKIRGATRGHSAGGVCAVTRGATRGWGAAAAAGHAAIAAGYNAGEINSLEYNKAYIETIKLCADIVRETIPIELIEKAAILKDKEDVIREIIE